MILHLFMVKLYILVERNIDKYYFSFKMVELQYSKKNKYYIHLEYIRDLRLIMY